MNIKLGINRYVQVKSKYRIWIYWIRGRYQNKLLEYL